MTDRNDDILDFSKHRTIPAEVTRVDGCTCGGIDSHASRGQPGGCAIWDLPPEQMMAAVDAARDRIAAHVDGLNVRLRAALREVSGS